MPRDASLDEFFGGAGAEGSRSSGDEQGETVDDEESTVGDEIGSENEASESEDVEASVSPAEATYMWTPAGDACARCGSETGRMWRCSGEMVCGECKEW